MAITSYAAAKTQLEANSLWFGSVSMARLYYEAGDWLNNFRSSGASAGQTSFNFAPVDLTEVRKFLIAADSTNVRTYFARGRARTSARPLDRSEPELWCW